MELAVPVGRITRGDPTDLGQYADVALVAHWDLPGRWSPSIRAYVAELQDCGVLPVIVTTALGGGEYCLNWELPDRAIVIARENVGYDFGSWAAARSLLDLAGKRVFLTNDSMLGPFGSLKRLIAAARTSDAEVWAASGSLQIRPHLQSFLLRFNPNVWSSVWLEDFFSSVRPQRTKMRVVRSYEIGLSDELRRRGVSTAVYFSPSSLGAGRHNPTLVAWREMLDRGFPFLKRTLLSDPRVRVPYAELAAGVAGAFGTDLSRFATPSDPAHKSDLRIEMRSQVRQDTRCIGAAVRRAFKGARHAPDELETMPGIELIEEHGTPGASLAVVMHCHYLELVPDLIARLRDFGAVADLILTTTSEFELPAVPDNVTSVRVYRVPNRGRDLLPLVSLANEGVLDSYDVICKAHTKRSVWRRESPRFESSGDSWREALVSAVLAPESAGVVTAAMDSDPRIMLITAPGQLKDASYWGADLPKARQLAKRVGLPFDPRALRFAAGSMYWARGTLLRELASFGLTAADFELEEGQDDGTTAHALERLIGILADAQGTQRDDLLPEAMAPRRTAS